MLQHQREIMKNNIIDKFLLFICITISYHVHGMNMALIEPARNQEIAQENTHYNQTSPLINLPEEIISSCIAHINPLEKSVQAYSALHYSCKHFNRLSFKSLVDIYKTHDKQVKNEAMKKFLSKINDVNYWDYRYAASLLIGAGADNNPSDRNSSLLKKAVQRKDKDLIKFLFDCGVNPNSIESIIGLAEPTMFSIKDVETAEIFDKYKVDWNQRGLHHPNILFASLFNNFSSKLVDFYLKHGVDVKKWDKDKGCLLHAFIFYFDINLIKNVDDCVKIGELIVEAAPELVNAVDRKGETPIQKVQNRINRLEGNLYREKERQVSIALLKLFEETAEKLKKENK